MAKKKVISTQRYLDIAEMREGVVIMKDGSMRMVILTSSVNFSLKSEDEQSALVASYVSFLNSLEFPLQIVIQSRELNIDEYIERLKEQEKEQTNELLRLQIADYRSFVSELIEIGQIMSKHFYVVVPYDPLSDRKKTLVQRASDLFVPARVLRLKEDQFRKRVAELDRRVGRVLSELQGLGLNAVVLDTQSLIELFYNTYNPDVSAKQKLVDLNRLQVEE